MSANESPTAERTRTVVVRRITTVTAVCGSFVLVVALLPLALPIALIHDLVRGTRLKAARCLLLLAWFLFCEVWGLAVTALLLLGEATIARGDRERGDRWFYALESLWSGALFHGAERIFHFRIVVDPASDRGMGPLIVFARHASIGDVLLPLLLLAPRGLRMRYVMKQELRVDPCLDIVGDRVPNTFVRRDSGDSAPEIAAVVRLLANLSARDCVVIFPEGTRFTPAKRARVLARIAASGNPEAERRALRLKHVLPPRPGGTLGLLDANPGADVLFFATTGFEGIATVWDLWAGRLIGATIRVFTWRVPYAEIPKDKEGRLAWLAENWQQIDDWVGEHRGRPES